MGYDKAEEVGSNWMKDADEAVANFQFGLRRAGEKAWNVYAVFLAASNAGYAGSIRISAIEEDLGGTRKIARADILELADVRSAFLPLLPIQAAPRLDAVDMVFEISQRATELPDLVLKAFLSNVDNAVVVQTLEDS